MLNIVSSKKKYHLQSSMSLIIQLQQHLKCQKETEEKESTWDQEIILWVLLKWIEYNLQVVGMTNLCSSLSKQSLNAEWTYLSEFLKV